MKYAAKKIGLMLLTMVIVSFLAFLAFQVIPGDPAVKLLGTEATPERIAALRAEMGLDRPFFERYVQWVLGALKGDFGTSYSYKMPVSSMLAGKGMPCALNSALFQKMTQRSGLMGTLSIRPSACVAVLTEPGPKSAKSQSGAVISGSLM